ncbi:YheC/YheD family endospore coat-associated protein [Thermoflavimicrobium dichotomicum]|uniref:YheC/D like ATP-grasp n=1 Tax=Thermoflavimicrobium dichotomicum TaxID=46223 RepID=A0A1I3LEH8_9BACL|nr:YheC/YheD family protein [Thermoflavimicrobium dichotomicum]SFI83087.1 YheC/D like ATP-grasp [Thermoflavimicrobium dichotomicum]
MNSMICQIRITDQFAAKAVILSPRLLKNWNCEHGQWIQIELGNKSVHARVVQGKQQGHIITLPAILARQLSFPYASQTRAYFHNQKLRLGPVIGILTTGYTGNPATPFGARTVFFQNFLTAGASEKPFIYVFTPEMIHWPTKTVTGLYYKKDAAGVEQWVRHVSPLPDVVYERVPNRKAESLTRVRSCLLRLKEEENCRIFNQGFFDKWTIYELLKDEQRTKGFTPETHLAPSIETIKYMLDKYHMVYLKPSGGSLGMGILRITYHPKHGYFCRFHQGERNVLHRFQSVEKLLQYYFRHQPHRFKNYLVQQGIRLLKVNGRPVDFRVHMHKDSTGNWKVVGIAAKVAGSGCITTHVRTGGTVYTDDILNHLFPEKAKNVKSSLVEAAIEIAEALEEKLSGPLGELGMDMGIDQQNQIWLFEVNSKPGRHIFHHPSLREAGRQSAKYITEYSLKLAEFV